MIEFHRHGMIPSDKWIFVFESNLSGYHVSDNGRIAIELFGAKMKFGEGLMNKSYALPIKDQYQQPFDDNMLKLSIQRFINFSMVNVNNYWIDGFHGDDEISKLYFTQLDTYENNKSTYSFTEKWLSSYNEIQNYLLEVSYDQIV